MSGNCCKLYQKAQQSRHNFSYRDFLKLARCAGYEDDHHHKSGGSHRILSRDREPYTLNVQPGKNGKAKPAQVAQLLKIIATTGGEPE